MSEQPGTVDTNLSMAIVYDTWSVATQAPGGISRLTAAISLAGTPEYSCDSPNTWSTVKVTRATAVTVVATGRTSASHLRLPPAGSAPSRREAGSASTSARNGARKAA